MCLVVVMKVVNVDKGKKYCSGKKKLARLASPERKVAGRAPGHLVRRQDCKQRISPSTFSFSLPLSLSLSHTLLRTAYSVQGSSYLELFCASPFVFSKTLAEAG